ncbi:hypothetical protein TNCV_4495821 [Trichonephila clavipes]|nr:hypothetical protein TNCV_4495821 [Trichonephila clavipes]
MQAETFSSVPPHKDISIYHGAVHRTGNRRDFLLSMIVVQCSILSVSFSVASSRETARMVVVLMHCDAADVMITPFLCTPKHCGDMSFDITPATYDCEKTQRLDTCELESPTVIQDVRKKPPSSVMDLYGTLSLILLSVFGDSKKRRNRDMQISQSI